MDPAEISEIISNLTTAWVIWVSSVSSLVTIGAWKQRKAMDAAFSKLRRIETLLEEKPWESKIQKKSSP